MYLWPLGSIATKKIKSVIGIYIHIFWNQKKKINNCYPEILSTFYLMNILFLHIDIAEIDGL